MSLILLFLMLLQLALSSVTALPFYTPPPIPQGFPVAADQPEPLISSSSTYYALPPRMHRYWIAISYHHPRANQSNGPFQLPHFHSGPWDRAWEAYNNIVEKAKIFKRGVDLSAQERIVQHLRANGWWQRVKDFFKRVTGGKVKVTRQQYSAVKDKYKYLRYQNMPLRKNGRTGSAFVTRPTHGKAPSKLSRFLGLSR
ncbi:uncharacterized protein SPSC_05464 [Sporisorium scitamineum]|uniref:Uncharacterized protein n=1 Tax=Sporisorium scitamineum TaxID=49012 RepID=A0A0F7S5Q1_9BASI|nr:uncharacterized protein SPSC_05464 [Sporisorium scitamineum]CDW96609.1 hypothetical protein [Sporisorium scitamineum]